MCPWNFLDKLRAWNYSCQSKIEIVRESGIVILIFARKLTQNKKCYALYKRILYETNPKFSTLLPFSLRKCTIIVQLLNLEMGNTKKFSFKMSRLDQTQVDYYYKYLLI